MRRIPVFGCNESGRLHRWAKGRIRLDQDKSRFRFQRCVQTVLVQREVESARSLLASITSLRRASLGRHLPLRAGGGTGGGSCNWFQKEIRLGRPITSPRGWKNNWLRQK